MSHGGYLETTKPRPIGLSVVVAAHVAVLAALMLAKGELLPSPPQATIISSIPDPTPKPPPENPVKREAHKNAQTTPTPVPIPTPRDPALPDPMPFPFPLPPSPIPNGAGSAGETVTPAPPVLVEAGIDPRFAGDFQPHYPASAQRAGISGKTTVRVRIGADGRVKAVEMIRADDPAFFEATQRQALRRWRFTPAMRDGVAIESVKVITVSFVLSGD